ncbi:ABC transporter substrate-binding protein [Aureimonas sp. AU40]|uniref:ABC transporter substrate-binding protein n=1 Tax=Aureimonas sp. AU40 TaxID=1637747 RepID=UPI0007850EE7|nr:ABC transporter substrate-binding protein [Aureimonas sp. AU40]
MRMMLCVTGLTLVLATAPAAAEAQVRSDTVTIVLPAAPDRLDPCETPRSVIGRIIRQNVVETLTELDYATSRIIPRLAESWEETAPNRWRFHLRAGVRFHDGSSFDAAAVVEALERTLDPALTCITRTKYFGGIDIKAEAIDPLTVEFVTATHVPILPTLLAQLSISSPATPRGVYTNEPVGTGPYRFAGWTQGESVRLERNPAYWGEEPAIGGARYIWRSESSVAAAMVETEEADLAFAIAPQDATDPATDKVYPNSDTALFRLSLDIPPLNDRRVREAINLSIDRRAFLGTIVSGEAQLATQQVGPSALGYNAALVPWPYDPDRATKLLAEARADGVAVDRPLRMIGRPGMFANSNEFVEAAAEMLRSVGLNVRLDNLEMSQWLKEANKPFAERRMPNLLLTMHDNNSGDASFTAFFKYGSEGRQSELHDAHVDALIAEAGAASGENRAQLYGEVFRTVYEDLVADVPLFHMVNVMRVGPRLDFKPTIANAVELQLARLRLRPQS